MLTLGSQVSGSTFGQKWEGTIVAYVVENSTDETKGRVFLSSPITDPAGSLVTDLVVPLNYRSPQMLAQLDKKLTLYQYSIRWTDLRRISTKVHAHWAVQHPDRIEFFLWNRPDPLATVSRDIRQVRLIERHRNPKQPMKLAPMIYPVKKRLRNTGAPDCPVCGVWECYSCWGYRRPEARRSVDNQITCGRCGEKKGRFLATRHLNPEKHLDTL